MAASLHTIYALYLLWRICWFYLPEGISAILDGELSWGELYGFMQFANHIDAGLLVTFEANDAPYTVSDAA